MLDYQSLFCDSLIIINGPARSGTSILGKLIGSMRPAYYLYEPVILQYPVFFQHEYQVLRVLFEDYFLPVITGRALNWNENEETHWRFYYDDIDILCGKRRTEVLDFITNVKPKFIIKLTDMIGWKLAYVKNILTNLGESCMCTIIRDGFNTVASSVSRGWYTDEWLEASIENPANSLPEADQWMWLPTAASPATRAACLWRNFVTENPTPDVYYERLIKTPMNYANNFEDKFGLRITAITSRHIADIQNRKLTYYDHDSIMVQIDQRERWTFHEAVSRYRKEVN